MHTFESSIKLYTYTFLGNQSVGSVAQSCPTLCNPMDCSWPGFPVLHHLLEFAQTHVHRWCHPTIPSSVTTFSSCPQSFPASGSLPVSQLFDQVAKVLDLQRQHQSSQWIFRVIFFTIDRSLQAKGVSRVFSNTTVGKHQFFSVQPSVWSKLT